MKETEKVTPIRSPSLIGKIGVPPHDDKACSEWPVLMELFLPRYDEKKRLVRDSGTISIRCEGSLFRVTLTCPTDDAMTYVDVTELQDLLTMLECHVSSPGVNWVQLWDSRKKARQRLKDVL
jgi:hypothetical protein